MNKTNLVDKFVTQVIAESDFTELDRIYLYNRVLALVGDAAMTAESESTNLLDLKNELVALAQQNGKCARNNSAQDILGVELMSLILPAPSIVNQRFWQYYETSPTAAISSFYHMSKTSDYIKTRAIAKNIYFIAKSNYGDLEITINLSKPEKDPKEIAAAKDAVASDYPKCQLCMENEGYQGRLNYPARSNHRIIRFSLGQEEWGFQYSPYAYFNEHCIFLSSKHEKMKIDVQTFSNLLTIVDKFPGYFVGSNADLPIVGGSILTHEHYQGGRHQFPMEKAPLIHKFRFAGFPDVEAGIVKWPMSVIRLRSSNSMLLVELAGKILAKWQNYSDEQVSVRAFSNNTQHHTITPIARMHDNKYELDLVLRDNQTSEEYPDGIFHPHPDVQHIKRENIGLIEVMGLAILPPRLVGEMTEVKKFLLKQPNQISKIHLEWASAIKEKHNITAENVNQVLQEELGLVFERVLEDAGVFKQTAAGKAAFMRFIAEVGLA